VQSKTFKRITAILLTLMMTLTLAPFSLAAEMDGTANYKTDCETIESNVPAPESEDRAGDAEPGEAGEPYETEPPSNGEGKITEPLFATPIMTVAGVIPSASSDAHIDMSDPSPPESGMGWAFADNVYTIQNGATVTVTGNNAGTNRRIEVAENATNVNLTIRNLTLAGFTGNVSPLELRSGANVTLTLEGDNTLTAAGNGAGIQTNGATITIVGNGSLVARGSGADDAGWAQGAGIGGLSQFHSGGNITITGGTIRAYGGPYTAGIGGASFGNGSNITITGGNVTARGNGSNAGGGAAGIGGGSGGDGGNILIYGENTTVNATGSYRAQDIGSGANSAAEGNVFVALPLGQLHRGNANIGNAVMFSVDPIMPNSAVTAALPAPLNSAPFGIEPMTLFTADETVTQMSVITTLGDSEVEFALSNGDNREPVTRTGTQLMQNGATVHFVIPEDIGDSINIADITPRQHGTNNSWTFNGTVLRINAGADITVTGTVTDGRRIEVAGESTLRIENLDVRVLSGNQSPLTVTNNSNLTLIIGEGDNYFSALSNREDNVTGHLRAGINVPTGSSIIIKAAETNSGSLTAIGGEDSAGIGGRAAQLAGNITIESGVVNAIGRHIGAGIGNGGTRQGNPSPTGSITISGGRVYAHSDHYSAAIGGGFRNTVQNINITGGVVTTSNRRNHATEDISIGGWTNGAALNISGNAVVIILNNRINANTSHSEGILSIPTNTTMLGDVTVQENMTFPANRTLTIGNGQTLTIPSGVTLTNNGTVIPQNGSTVTVAGNIAGTNLINGANVSPPDSESVTFYSVALSAGSLLATTGQDVQFAISTTNVAPAVNSNVWQTGLTFSGLSHDTNYYFFARSAANAHFSVGAASIGVPIRTDNLPIHNVTWNANGGTPSPSQTTVTHGDNVTEPVTMTRDNYTFGGWYRDAGFDTEAVFPIDNVTDNISLYARWIEHITSAAITITAPAVAVTPSAAAGVGNNVSFTAGAATWSPSHIQFRGETEYTATVTLTPNEGFVFTNITTATINTQDASATLNANGTLTVSLTFAQTGAATLTGIEILTQPTNLSYTHGDTLNLAGIVAMLHYNDGTNREVAYSAFVANGITASPAHGAALTHLDHDDAYITVSAGSFSDTTENITVSQKDIRTATVFNAEFPTLTFNNTPQEPAANTITVTADGLAVTFTLDSWEDNTDAGQASVVVTGTGNFTGTRPVNFTIGKATAPNNVNPTLQFYSVVEGTQTVDLTALLPTAAIAGSFGTPITYAVTSIGDANFGIITAPATTGDVTNPSTFAITVGAGATATNTATVTVTVTTQNFEDFDIVFTVNVIDRPALTIDGLNIYDSVFQVGTPHEGLRGGFTDVTFIRANNDVVTITNPQNYLTVNFAGTANDTMSYNAATPPTYAGSYTVTVTLDHPQFVGTWEQSFTISRDVPNVIPPTDLTAALGQQLSDITLPAGFTWTTPTDLVGDVGLQSHNMTFTPDDVENFNTMKLDVEIMVLNVTVPPGAEVEEDDDGNITVTLPDDGGTINVPPGSDVGIGDDGQIEITLPDDGGTITVPPGTDVEIEVDDDGNITVTLPGDGGTITVPPGTDVEIVVDDGDLVITVAVISISIDGDDTRRLQVGRTEQLTATVLPVSATNQNVHWSSSNTAVATVNANGVVSALTPGTALITVMTEDGDYTATVMFTVLAAPGSGPGPDTEPSVPTPPIDNEDEDEDDKDIDEPDVPLTPAPRFIDVGTPHWAFSVIDFVAERGIMQGVASDIFEPNTTLTRAMAAAILMRLAGETPTDSTSPFADVNEGAWFSDAIIWGSESGILLGVGNDLFNPSGELTREQFAALMFRFAQHIGIDTDIPDEHTLDVFADSANVSQWAVEYMRWAHYVGLINGVDESTLLPGGTATRAQTAAILYRFIAIMEQNEDY
jgi:uncharacterized repeat protein (TIGR02543 family)